MGKEPTYLVVVLPPLTAEELCQWLEWMAELNPATQGGSDESNDAICN